MPWLLRFFSNILLLLRPKLNKDVNQGNYSLCEYPFDNCLKENDLSTSLFFEDLTYLYLKMILHLFSDLFSKKICILVNDNARQSNNTWFRKGTLC